MPSLVFKIAHVVLALLLVGGCASTGQAPRILFQDANGVVRLDIDKGIKGPDDPDRYSHPAEITTAQLRTILDSVRIQPQQLLLERTFKGPIGRQRMFEQQDIGLLAARLREALVTATPQETVVFSLIKPVGTRQEATVGELYVKGDGLHLIVNCHQWVLEKGEEFPRQCRKLSLQGFELSLVNDEYLVGYGGALFGKGKKELVIDYTQIPSQETSQDTHPAARVAPPEAAVVEHFEEDVISGLPPVDDMSTGAGPAVEPHPLGGDLDTEPIAPDVEDAGLDPDAQIRAMELELQALQATILEQREQINRLHTPAPPSSSAGNPGRRLSLTSPLLRGEDVKTLQRILELPPQHIDGIFGKRTHEAVRDFQQKHGLEADGAIHLGTLRDLGYLP